MNLGRAIVTNGDITAYVCDSAATRPSFQITLDRLIVIVIVIVISLLIIAQAQSFLWKEDMGSNDFFIPRPSHNPFCPISEHCFTCLSLVLPRNLAN